MPNESKVSEQTTAFKRLLGIPQNKRVTLSYCAGSNGGTAIYLELSNGLGYRVAGPKCWGNIRPTESFELDERNLDDLIREARAAKRFLKPAPIKIAKAARVKRVSK